MKKLSMALLVACVIPRASFAYVNGTDAAAIIMDGEIIAVERGKDTWELMVKYDDLLYLCTVSGRSSGPGAVCGAVE